MSAGADQKVSPQLQQFIMEEQAKVRWATRHILLGINSGCFRGRQAQAGRGPNPSWALHGYAHATLHTPSASSPAPIAGPGAADGGSPDG